MRRRLAIRADGGVGGAAEIEQDVNRVGEVWVGVRGCGGRLEPLAFGAFEEFDVAIWMGK